MHNNTVEPLTRW